MSKSLVIVESPAKARTINKYLGEDYIVEASVGHVKDLPKGGLSIDVEKGFLPTYEIIQGKEEIVRKLRALAGRCDRVFLATDPDREGEAIAYHIAQEIRSENSHIRRVLFNEITKNGVTQAMKSPRDIDQPMVEAQEARRVMDRLIGYKVSPFLWRTFVGEHRGLSAGRVQSVALRLVVERERAINSFIPIEYWTLHGRFSTSDGGEINARLIRFDGTEIRNPSGSAADRKDAPEDSAKQGRGTPPFIATKEVAEALRERVLREHYKITSLTRKEVKRNAPLPFTTSTLQQEASKRLRMNPKKSMKLAQQLYEGADVGKRGRTGLVTYMRTDSTRVSQEATQAAHEYIFENYGGEYVPREASAAGATANPSPEKPRRTKKGDVKVQDAHEAIRPTDVKITPKEARRHLDKDLADLYELIWSRFVASRMSAAIIDQTIVDITGGPFVFRATGRITRFRGWLAVHADDEDETKGTQKAKERDGLPDDNADAVLPANIAKGNNLTLEEVTTRQSLTRAPPRYTESLLVKEMESKGIGRPSTYAAINATIQDRGYVEQKDRRLYAMALGMQVSDALVRGFPALFDVRFTARMEGDLDTIASGTATYQNVLQSFYRPLERALVMAMRSAPPSQRLEPGGKGVVPLPAKALRSGGRRTTHKGADTRELKKGDATKGGDSAGKIVPSRRTPREIVEGVICPSCGGGMVKRKGPEGNEFYGCANYPECRATRAVSLGITCPGCGKGEIVARTGGRYNSLFYGCNTYPECRFTSSLRPVNTPCASCGNQWMTEAWSNEDGDFRECPKCKARG